MPLGRQSLEDGVAAWVVRSRRAWRTEMTAEGLGHWRKGLGLAWRFSLAEPSSTLAQFMGWASSQPPWESCFLPLS